MNEQLEQKTDELVIKRSDLLEASGDLTKNKSKSTACMIILLLNREGVDWMDEKEWDAIYD